MRDANLLSCRPHCNPAFPVEPVCARLRSPIRPTITIIKLGNQSQPTETRRIDVAGIPSDLACDFRDRTFIFRFWISAVHLHSPIKTGDIYSLLFSVGIASINTAKISIFVGVWREPNFWRRLRRG